MRQLSHAFQSVVSASLGSRNAASRATIWSWAQQTIVLPSLQVILIPLKLGNQQLTSLVSSKKDWLSGEKYLSKDTSSLYVFVGKAAHVVCVQLPAYYLIVHNTYW